MFLCASRIQGLTTVESGEGIESLPSVLRLELAQKHVESGEGIESFHRQAHRHASRTRWNPVKELKG